MKRALIQLVLILSMVTVGNLGVLPAYAAGEAPAPAAAAAPAPQNAFEGLSEILSTQKTGLSDFSGRLHPNSSVDQGTDILTSIIFTVLDFLKYILGTIVVIFVIVQAIQLITAGKRVDEVSEKVKSSFKYIIIGFILIIVADELVTKVFFGDYGECLASADTAKDCAKAGGSVAKGVYSLILALLSSIAVLVLVLAGFRMVMAGGNEEVVTAQKKRIGWAVVGLILAGVGEFAVKGILFRDGGTKGIDFEAARKLVFTFTNFIAAFIGTASFAVMLYGGYLYVASFGNEEQTGKAKKMITGAIVGILIALAAFGIVRTISTFSPTRDINLPQEIPGQAR